jgi:hypothetical protein
VLNGQVRSSLAEVLDDPEEIDRRYADFERQEAQKKIDRLAEAERLKDVAKRRTASSAPRKVLIRTSGPLLSCLHKSLKKNLLDR